jgi:ABC-type glycerol-3-phosphate transport system substrate-binding protein
MLAIGTSAMYITYATPPQQDRESIGVLPFPKFSEGIRAVNSLSGGIAISEKTKHPDLAWEFMKFIAIDKDEVTTDIADLQWGLSNPLVEAVKDDENYRVNKVSFSYVKKDMYDLNINIWNVSFAKVNYQLRQVILSSDVKSELTTLARLLESTLQ